MASVTSQNGWPVHLNQSKLVPLSYVTGRVASGDVHAILAHFCAWFDKHVEPITKGHSWGYAYRAIRGQSSGYSNHASGTAIDLNAPKHPLGSSGTFTAAQAAAIRKQLERYDGALRWGGDYNGRKDEMHVEINCNAAKLRQVVKAMTAKRVYSTSLKRLLANAKSKAPRAKSNDVIRLQRLLKHADCMSTSAAKRERGKYGPLTRQAVRTAQRKAGYPDQASGYIGIRVLRWLAKRAKGTSVETRVVR